MEDQRFSAMNQSILLASKLLEIGMPYLASWLPDPNYRVGYSQKDSDRRYEIVDIRTSLLTDKHIQVVRNELNEILKGLEWWEDPEMLENNEWWGITTSCYPRATSNFSRRQIVISTRMDENLISDSSTRRQNTKE
jgi:hypothetical protein